MEDSIIDIATQYWIDEMLKKDETHSLNPIIEDFKLFLNINVILDIKKMGFCVLEVNEKPNKILTDLFEVFDIPTLLLPTHTSMVVTMDEIKLNGDVYSVSKSK